MQNEKLEQLKKEFYSVLDLSTDLSSVADETPTTENVIDWTGRYIQYEAVKMYLHGLDMRIKEIEQTITNNN